EGPAVMFTGRGLTLTNTVLWDGVHEGLNGFIKVPDGLIPGNAETVSTVTHSLVPGGCPGTGNVTGSPAFVAPVAGDYRLMPGSACVDAGTAVGAPDIDINNVPRPRGAGIDIGAHEKP
ncbi:MAG: hypothetical protein GY851_30840, partial [bacterium]|nr:hypothetical protein [bacterium]